MVQFFIFGNVLEMFELIVVDKSGLFWLDILLLRLIFIMIYCFIYLKRFRSFINTLILAFSILFRPI